LGSTPHRACRPTATPTVAAKPNTMTSPLSIAYT
jgi:hypothetical protein